MTWRADYFQPPFIEGRDNRDENGRDDWAGPEDESGRDRDARAAIENQYTADGTRRAVWLSAPLGRTYRSADVFRNHSAAVDAAIHAYNRLSSAVRNASRNSPAFFLELMESPTGRLWLKKRAGVVFLDDAGFEVDCLGHRIDFATAPGERDDDYWLTPGGSPVSLPSLDVYGVKNERRTKKQAKPEEG